MAESKTKWFFDVLTTKHGNQMFWLDKMKFIANTLRMNGSVLFFMAHFLNTNNTVETKSKNKNAKVAII